MDTDSKTWLLADADISNKLSPEMVRALLE
jgi:hypothetical protein